MNTNLKNKVYQVKNRSASVVTYRIPEDNIRREFMPSEVKKISFNELEHLSFQAGGREIMANFLQIMEEEAIDSLGIPHEAEYDMSEKQIIELLKNGSIEAFLDALDFAPPGVIDLIKKYSVSLPLMDIPKREAMLNKLQFNVEAAIKNAAEDTPVVKTERDTEVTTAKPVVRRTNANYKVVSPKN